MAIETLHFDFEGTPSNDDLWRSCHALHLKIAHRYAVTDPVPGTWQLLRELWQRVEYNRPADPHALILENGVSKVYLHSYRSSFSPQAESVLDFDVLDNAPSDGLLNAVASELFARIETAGVTQIRSKVWAFRQIELLRSVGAREVSTSLLMTLKRDAMEAVRYRSIAHRISERNPDIRLVHTQHLQEEWIDSFAELYSLFLQTIQGEEEHRMVTAENVRAWEHAPGAEATQHCTLLFDGERMIAHTAVTSDSASAAILQQRMTGVHPDYRGRGLGLWMKAHLYAKLLEDVPGFSQIRTDVLELNNPMIAINKQLGFQVLDVGCKLELTRHSLEERMKVLQIQ